MSAVAVRTQRVLIVDDNPSIHEDIRKVLRTRETNQELDELEQALFGSVIAQSDGCAFETDSAYQGQEALRIIQDGVQRGEHFDAAVVDMRMPPGWDGVETIQKLWEVDPNIQVIICTALSDYTWDEVTRCLGHSDRYLIIKKPFEPCELLQAVRALCEKRRLWSETTCRLSQIEHVVEQRTSELRQAHREAELLLSAISSVMIWLDATGRITRWNEAAESAFGLSGALVSQQRLLDLPIVWDAPQRIQELLSQSVSSSMGHVELVLTNHLSRRITLWCSVYPIRESGESHGILLIGTDVTQQRLLEQQLNQAQKLESIGQLAAGVAHEINTPMQYIGDNVSYLRGTVSRLTPLLECVREHLSQSTDSAGLSAAVLTATEDVKLDRVLQGLPSVFEDLNEGITHITQIVRAMKEFAHPGSEAQQSVDLNHALQSTIVVAKNEWKYVAEIETALDPDLPLVDGYPHELNQVFLNLLINAAHAIASVTPEGKKGKISLTTYRDDDAVIVEICDTGGGIPPAIQDRVFDPFFTTKEVGKGTGQGLAIAHRVVVLQHKGRLWFDSEEGVGTTFHIWLPQSK